MKIEGLQNEATAMCIIIYTLINIMNFNYTLAIYLINRFTTEYDKSCTHHNN